MTNRRSFLTIGVAAATAAGVLWGQMLIVPMQDPISDNSCWYYGWIVFYLGWVAFFSPPPIDGILGAIVAIATAAQAVFC